MDLNAIWLCPYEKGKFGHTDTERSSCEEGDRGQGDAAETTDRQQSSRSSGRGLEQVLPHGLRRNQPCPHPDLRLPAS